jgi:antirestriction protein ArdC
MTRTAWRAPARSHLPANRASLYEDITNKIIAELEAGRLPWVQPWGAPQVSAPLGIPRNAATGRCYSGINVLILWGAVVQHGFSIQSWLTFRQALGLGGNVRKGERGTTVVYADRFVPDDERQRACDEGEAPRSIPFLKRFTVFNAEQCEGLPDTIAASAPSIASDLIRPQAEALIRATGADLRIGGDRAYYDVTGDYVRVPPPQAFFEPINWHRTACHELAHWTGAGHRLARDMSGSFGSKTYAQEELERSAALTCARRSESYRPCAMPTMWGPGSTCCARTAARSSAQHRRRRRRRTTCLRSCRELVAATPPSRTARSQAGRPGVSPPDAHPPASGGTRVRGRSRKS